MADTNTIIGDTILVQGNLQGDEDLTVQGRIEGTVNLSKTLIIEQNGIVKADVEISNAVISGVMVGNLTASDSVEITETGRMLGDIRSPRIMIVEGALFKGNVDMGDLEMPRPESTSSSAASDRRPAYTPRPLSRPEPKATPPSPSRPVARPAPAPAPAPAPMRVEKKVVSAEKPRPAKKKVVVKKRRH